MVDQGQREKTNSLSTKKFEFQKILRNFNRMKALVYRIYSRKRIFEGLIDNISAKRY